eukprot:TRINITY_DN1084_c0_g1_i3.p1 TRINITY_DN1084_c0_g1~~TRINITY_DN1084_c0_g1_i3.p1  ORF type:complete len:669 (+),score=262.39 TRINITY_DN1084_c0_g1_i3:153-2159(+)
MPQVYNFKRIQVVPSSSDFIDIILSKTNRKTPTLIHKGYAIQRIRAFYTRKVKFTQQNFHEKLEQILTDFPILDEIHPFYADLINVLYDRDHYKLALGQLNTCKHLVDNLGSDYVRLLKYADSLYQCKQLKRAALGRMCTLMRKQNPSLEYLEQVRQHLSRLPSIDPNTRSLILCGYPNVGKSSFMNILTKADVEVQPYAFTTKSLFVGHMDYNYSRWQVIDTPGLLDHPLGDCNTIEMQSITALAHIVAAIIFVIDISEKCGYSIEEQINLFNNIKPLFSNKPLIVAANKTDLITPEELTEEQRNALFELEQDNDLVIIPMSTYSEEGLMDVKQHACKTLLDQRVETRMKSKHVQTILNRIYVAQPKKRDNKERTVYNPSEELLQKKLTNQQKKEAKQQLKEHIKLNDYFSMNNINIEYNKDYGDIIDPETFTPDYYKGTDWRKNYLLKNDEWKFDNIPEFYNGKNVADFIDPDIEDLLDELEREEDERLRLLQAQIEEDDELGFELSEEDQALIELIREEKNIKKQKHFVNKSVNSSALPRIAKSRERTPAKIKEHLESIGIDPSMMLEEVRSRSKSKSKSRGRSKSLDIVLGKKRKRIENEHSLSMSEKGLRNVKQRKLADKMEKEGQRKWNKGGKAGEADRRIVQKLPKHLFSGKRGVGKTDRR